MKDLALLFSSILCLISPAASSNPARSRRPTRQSKRQTTYYPSNYGGAALDPSPDGTPFHYATTQISIPTVEYVPSQSTPPSRQRMSAWIGFGPTNLGGGTGLAQTGCATVTTGPSAGQSTQCWYEFYPNPLVYFSGFSPAAGTTILLELTRVSNTQAYAKLTDLSTSGAVSATFDAPAGYSAPGQNVEWIVESHYRQGVPVPDFAYQFFEGCEATTEAGNTYGPGDGQYRIYDQVNPGNALIMSAVLPSDSEVQVNYVGPTT